MPRNDSDRRYLPYRNGHASNRKSCCVSDLRRWRDKFTGNVLSPAGDITAGQNQKGLKQKGK
jgi:hypothetical protein